MGLRRARKFKTRMGRILPKSIGSDLRNWRLWHECGPHPNFKNRVPQPAYAPWSLKRMYFGICKQEWFACAQKCSGADWTLQPKHKLARNSCTWVLWYNRRRSARRLRLASRKDCKQTEFSFYDKEANKQNYERRRSRAWFGKWRRAAWVKVK